MTDRDRAGALEIVKLWGSDFVVSRRRVSYPHKGKAFVLEDNNRITGLAAYEITGQECELTLIEVMERNKGYGAALFEKVLQAAKEAGCRRLWLVTTNNNARAQRFYEKQGMILKAVHKDAMNESRRIKPSIPLKDENGVEIKDEMEFEISL